ncbi:Salivary gland secretion 1 [Rhodotorula toruloides ATCC 204091]|uniref:Salivary gland secretion 1 n=1 Tax=Rhodotorula toruloides TaxID=5286 RepID=A0A0K3CGM5_RHOTO|nr:Salivary gland secretion 1 [Rhodotorula toruloides ATCC 204091]KAK4334123.1 Salivary gland secretion 1 [Rhodotorula toruloides]PRQ72404.1 salivary gland secretion 1 [Rhodotorula toruloides]
MLADSPEATTVLYTTTGPPPGLPVPSHVPTIAAMTPLPDSPKLAPTDETPAQTETKRIGACLVCGEETTKLCSKCLGAAFDLFFCSPEHQKLICRDHHRVCGRPLVPDSRPWLSKQEALEAVAHMDVPRRFNDGRVASMLDYLRHAGFPPPMMVQHIYRLTEGHEHPYDPYTSHAALVDVRMLEIRRKCPAGDLNEVLGTIDTFQLTSELLNQLWPCTPTNKVWHSGMNHRLVIFVSYLRQFRAGNRSISFEACQNAYKQIEAYLASPAAKMLNAERDVFLEGLHAYIDPDTLVIRLSLCDWTPDGCMTNEFKERIGRYRRAAEAK